MAKQYKPGQFVWIYGKQHRITKALCGPVCSSCPYGKELDCPSAWKCFFSFPVDCYPKPI